jgi:soluble P-type ATPase
VTGDHALTARAVAELVGLDVRDDRVTTGAELEALDDRERTARIRDATVLARIRPEQKYEIVDRLVAAGEVVAMAGDGINDAPALRRASIGVSMGAGATEVAREAAGMILLRDDLGAIVESVHRARPASRSFRAACSRARSALGCSSPPAPSRSSRSGATPATTPHEPRRSRPSWPVASPWPGSRGDQTSRGGTPGYRVRSGSGSSAWSWPPACRSC